MRQDASSDSKRTAHRLCTRRWAHQSNRSHLTSVSITEVRPMIRILAIAVTVVILAATTGACRPAHSAAVAPTSSATSSASSPTPATLLDPHGNVVLYVSNQSIALGRVDIAIEVDGQPVVEQDFDVGSQHSYKQFTLQLAPGRQLQGELLVAVLGANVEVLLDDWLAVDFDGDVDAPKCDALVGDIEDHVSMGVQKGRRRGARSA